MYAFRHCVPALVMLRAGDVVSPGSCVGVAVRDSFGNDSASVVEARPKLSAVAAASGCKDFAGALVDS